MYRWISHELSVCKLHSWDDMGNGKLETQVRDTGTPFCCPTLTDSWPSCNGNGILNIASTNIMFESRYIIQPVTKRQSTIQPFTDPLPTINPSIHQPSSNHHPTCLIRPSRPSEGMAPPLASRVPPRSWWCWPPNWPSSETVAFQAATPLALWRVNRPHGWLI